MEGILTKKEIMIGTLLYKSFIKQLFKLKKFINFDLIYFNTVVKIFIHLRLDDRQIYKINFYHY